jgi:hypothetical protein
VIFWLLLLAWLIHPILLSRLLDLSFLLAHSISLRCFLHFS